MDTPSPSEATTTTATRLPTSIDLSENLDSFWFDEDGKHLTVPRDLEDVGLRLCIRPANGTTIAGVRSRVRGSQMWVDWVSAQGAFLSPPFRAKKTIEVEISDGAAAVPVEGGGFIFVDDEGGNGLSVPA